ncbi:MAG: primosomal protein N' [Chitinivibrionales bacterium]|nr:primosomal protein N' [Chitinivibrionales bacterium]MBD3355669.1 primosomal protein N' [Chitinivibrionales bacterium]
MVASIAFPIAVPGIYDYQVPQELRELVVPGVPVKVDLNNRLLWGVVVRLKECSDYPNLKAILEVKGKQWTRAGRSLVRLYEWIASYYQCDLGKVFKPLIRKRFADMKSKTVQVFHFSGSIPPNLTPKQKEAAEKVRQAGNKAYTRKEWSSRYGLSAHIVDMLSRYNVLCKTERRLLREADELSLSSREGEIVLTPRQREALDSMAGDLENPSKPYLLYGITGSGKTLVYIELARKALARGRGVIVLVPEISLTPQTIRRFREALGDVISVIHSRMSDGERRDSLDELVSGRKRMVIGVRSAVLAPMEDVGLIIVDEEHDGSYKQSDIDPRYHARDMAVMRGRFQNALVVLGSATPSFESYHNALNGKYGLIRLLERFGEATLPTVRIVDMNQERQEGNWAFLSRYLEERTREALASKRQVIFLLNRRGFSTMLMCKDCGHTYACSNCSVNLIYHQADTTLKCHQCGYEEAAPSSCAKCRGEQIKYRGTGIQKAEEHLRMTFPDAGILRMDQDSTRRKGAHISILDAFARREADILLGTQMVAKGLNFPGVVLVGVLQADIGLHFPDFRSSERTFQLLTQVAGRAGRTDRLGEVVIQSSSPDEPCIVLAQTHNYEAFFRDEIEARRLLNYPPFGRLVRLVVQGEAESLVKDHIDRIANYLCRRADEGVALLGPAPAVLSRLNRAYRYSLLLKGTSARALQKVVHSMRMSIPKPHKDIRVIIDVDPVSML